MSVPPNRIGGVRGPNGATLDDVVESLFQIQQYAERTAIAVENMESRLRYLVGDDSPDLVGIWNGLPYNFTSAVGINDSDSFGALFKLGQVVAGLGSVQQALFLQPPNSGLPPSAVDYLSQLAAGLTSSAGDTAFSRLGSMRDNLEAVLSAIGTLPSSPANETVKSLLAAMVACCEGGGEVFNPLPPETGCLTSPPAWQECTLQFKFTAGALDIYQVIFPALVEGNPDTGNVEVGSTTENALCPLGPGPYQFVVNVCTAWSFAPGTVPTEYDIFTSNDISSDVPLNSYVSGSAPGASGQQGNAIPQGAFNFAARPGLSANFAFPTGVVPSGKVWVMVEQ